VSEQTAQKVHMERFNLKKLSEVEPWPCQPTTNLGRKRTSNEPHVETEFGNRFPAGQQTSSPKGVLLQTAQSKLFLSSKTGIRGRKVRWQLTNQRVQRQGRGEIEGMQEWVEAMTSQSRAIWYPA
jgi:hypothetical protein